MFAKIALFLLFLFVASISLGIILGRFLHRMDHRPARNNPPEL